MLGNLIINHGLKAGLFSHVTSFDLGLPPKHDCFVPNVIVA